MSPDESLSSVCNGLVKMGFALLCKEPDEADVYAVVDGLTRREVTLTELMRKKIEEFRENFDESYFIPKGFDVGRRFDEIMFSSLGQEMAVLKKKHGINLGEPDVSPQKLMKVSQEVSRYNPLGTRLLKLISIILEKEKKPAMSLAQKKRLEMATRLEAARMARIAQDLDAEIVQQRRMLNRLTNKVTTFGWATGKRAGRNYLRANFESNIVRLGSYGAALVTGNNRVQIGGLKDGDMLAFMNVPLMGAMAMFWLPPVAASGLEPISKAIRAYYNIKNISAEGDDDIEVDDIRIGKHGVHDSRLDDSDVESREDLKGLFARTLVQDYTDPYAFEIGHFLMLLSKFMVSAGDIGAIVFLISNAAKMGDLHRQSLSRLVQAMSIWGVRLSSAFYVSGEKSGRGFKFHAGFSPYRELPVDHARTILIGKGSDNEPSLSLGDEVDLEEIEAQINTAGGQAAAVPLTAAAVH